MVSVAGIATITGTSLFSLYYSYLAFRSPSAPPITPQDWYTNEKGEIAWQLSTKMYCPMAEFGNMPWAGLVEDFKYTKTIWWERYDVTGLVGYMPSQKTIYVVFRGTDSKPNEEMDFEEALVPYDDTWPECNCRVHDGVNTGVNAVYDDVDAEVRRLQAEYPDYEVQVVGHSLGGSLATLCQMKLIANGIDAHRIDIGSFRVGDFAFADFANSVMPQSARVVNFQDFAAHLMHRFQGYRHVDTEYYQMEDDSIRQCASNTEDPTCSYQWEWKLWSMSFEDHVWYYGHPYTD